MIIPKMSQKGAIRGADLEKLYVYLHGVLAKMAKRYNLTDPYAALLEDCKNNPSVKNPEIAAMFGVFYRIPYTEEYGDWIDDLKKRVHVSDDILGTAIKECINHLRNEKF